ncbi:acylneuraminate cytidylyltransferase family protein [Flavobacteriaceae bacterium XHP0103]|uniref:acylneuraminate cytidylyltransferase family protein n=1 Tax=Marixanthotalea marina TaxID=2844359 RepID=UPI002989C8DD|nr:acylneuraminate cytidylyltransferase family protein [Marixanthotalea marina]MBU3822732.1 acylneuraminate cytidylyltransferase family protein [Marixanthotalea marina]
MRILAIIPARGGSKGIPNKNIKLLQGKPLLAYTVEIARQSNYFSELIVSSEDASIIDMAKQYGVRAPFVRPKGLAQDDTPTIDVVIHALKWYKKRSVFFDAVCLLQVTCPFRTIEFLEASIAKFIESGCDSLVSVQRVPHKYNPHWTFELNEAGYLEIATGDDTLISRRQELPVAYHRDGSIYITKTDVILNQHSLYGKQMAFMESPEEHEVNIDTPEDWHKAETIIKGKTQ